MKSRIQNSGARNQNRPANAPAMMAVFEKYAQERVRQRQLLLDGKILFDCASPIVSDDRKLRTATEELGEIAEAIDRLQYSTRRGKVFAQEDLQAELVQLGAVVTAWLESFENKNGGKS